METKKKINIPFVTAIICLCLTIVVAVAWQLGRKTPVVAQTLASENVQPTTPKFQPITVEKAISAQVISDGLRELGKLVTEEYYFTDVLSYSSALKFLGTFNVPFTTSGFLVSYDGVVTAGVDFEKIEVIKDEDSKLITVRLPAPEIMNVDIDPESFVLHAEKTGLGNPVSVSDFNRSLAELESSAREKAVDKGLLIRAGENAERVISHFVDSLLEPGAYTVRYDRQGG